MKIGKMKCIAVILSSITLATALCGQSETGPTPIPTPTAPPLPISSPDVLRQYALGATDSGGRYAYSPTMDWNYPNMVIETNVTGKYAEDVLKKLFAATLNYRMINLTDKITGYVYLRNVNGDSLFFGSAEYTAESMRKEKPVYSIWQQPTALPVSGVDEAELIVLNDDGTTADRLHIQVNNGRPQLPPWYAGAPNGILALRFKDGSVVTYRLANPVGTKPGSLLEDSEFNIPGHYIYEGSTSGVSVKIMELWHRPTVFLDLPVEQDVTLDVVGLLQESGGLEVERPFWYQVTSDNGTKVISLPKQAIKVRLPAGKVRLLFGWNKFGEPSKLYAGPSKG